jgi:adenylate cyclase
MALEIERKFLVKDDSYIQMAESVHVIEQYYLSLCPERTVRVRIFDDRAFLTVKGKNSGCVRHEWEYEIPISDARQMIEITDGVGISKRRFIVNYAGHRWEVDRFSGRHEGLVLAEIELKDASEQFSMPEFIGKEVTDDKAYYNSVLVLNPNVAH